MQSSDKYSEQVSVSLGRSQLAEGFVAATATSTLLLVWAIPLAIELQVLAVGWTGLVALAALRRLRALGRLTIERSGEAHVNGIGGSICDGSFVAPWLTVVRWRPPGAWFDRTVPIAPDMLDAEDFRRLRVLLRFGGKPGQTRV